DQRRQEFRRQRAVDDPVIDGDRDPGTAAGHDLRIDHHGSRLDGAEGDDTTFRRVDDGGASLDRATGPAVGDGDVAAAHLAGRPPAFRCSRAAIRLVASNRANSVNCGMVETDRTIWRAMALRIPTTLMRRSPSVDGAAGAAAGSAAAASTSDFVIRPAGPVPV